MKLFKNGFNFITIASIVLIVIGVAVLVFISNKVGLFLPKRKPVAIVPPINQVISAEEYAKWKNYTNSEMKYSLKYPEDWVLEENSTSQLSLYSQSRFKIKSESEVPIQTNITVKIFSSLADLPNNLEKNLDLENWVKEQAGSSPVSKIMVDGSVGYEIILPYPTRVIYSQKDNLIYSIFDSSAGQSAAQKQIVDSFKFE